MSTEKVNSFVGKFMALWATGEDVVLTYNAKNGKAKVNIELDLGYQNYGYSVESLQSQQPYGFTAFSNSRKKRSERRLKERDNNLEKAMKVTTEEVEAKTFQMKR